MSDKALVKHPQKELARLEDGEHQVYIKNWKIGRLEEDIWVLMSGLTFAFLFVDFWPTLERFDKYQNVKDRLQNQDFSK